MLKKIVQKLHLAELMYRLECSRKVSIDPLFHNVHEALDYLHSVSPDLGHSCITNRALPSPDCDLEVIVPCYNAEKYVEECLESILSQKTTYNFFLTIINDGSKDHTREILQKYVGRSNVRIIDQENSGHSGARNSGIAQVHGRYLMFLDSDDILLPGAIEKLMSLAMQNDADIVDSSHIRFADRTQKGIKSKLMACIYDIVQRPQSLPYNLTAISITGYPWGKVIKSELFSRVEFPLGYWFEDTIVWMILLPLARRIVTSDMITIRYRMNPNSVSHVAALSNKSIDSLYVTLQLINDRENLDIKFDKNSYELLLTQFRMNFNRVARLDVKTKYAVFLLQKYLLEKRFDIWNTTDPHLKCIQDFLKFGDFRAFELWCKWH